MRTVRNRLARHETGRPEYTHNEDAGTQTGQTKISAAVFGFE